MGHDHTLRVNKSTNLQDFERLEVHAGASNPPAEEGYAFRYNWLTLSMCTLQTGRQLVVALWPRVWTFSSTGFVADRNILQGRESKDICLALSETVTETAAGESEESQRVPGLAGPRVEGSTVPENEYYIITRDDKDFRRLQFLFWKKLNRNQRVLVLAELGMLPDDFQMQPIWLRRGLDAARHQGRLRELWGSVMSRLPDDQQEANPFSS